MFASITMPPFEPRDHGGRHSEFMAFGDQRLARGLRDTRLYRHIAGIHRVRKGRGREAARGPARGLDCLLDVHAEIDHVDQRLHGAHDLIVAAGAAQDRVRLAVFHHERALQRAARALAGLEGVGLAADQRIIVAAAIEEDAGVAHDDAGAEQIRAGWARS